MNEIRWMAISIDGKLGKVWRGDVTIDRIRLEDNEAAVFEIGPGKRDEHESRMNANRHGADS